MTTFELDTDTQYPTITVDKLDDGSGVINFDVIDDNEDQPIASAGYVMTRQDNENRCYIVNVFNADGDVLSETVVPFNFKEF